MRLVSFLFNSTFESNYLVCKILSVYLQINFYPQTFKSMIVHCFSLLGIGNTKYSNEIQSVIKENQIFN